MARLYKNGYISIGTIVSMIRKLAELFKEEREKKKKKTSVNKEKEKLNHF